MRGDNVCRRHRRHERIPWQNELKMVSRDPRSHGKSASPPESGRTDKRDAPTAGNRVARTPQPMPWERSPIQPRFQRQGEWRPDDGQSTRGSWQPGDEAVPRGGWQPGDAGGQRAFSSDEGTSPGIKAPPAAADDRPRSPRAGAGWQPAGSRRSASASAPGPSGARKRRTKAQGSDYTNEQLSHDNPAWQPRHAPVSRKNRDRESRLALEHLQRRGSPLWDAWERLSALGRDLQTILPNIALQPLKLERQTLVVTAASSAMAARLRQYEPRLLEGLQARGWLVTRIRFKPTTLHRPREPERRQKAPVPPRAIESMAALAESEDISPRLREALQHFVARQRGYWGI